MITLCIIALILAVMLIIAATGCVALLDPLIAILIIWLIVKIIKKCKNKKED